MFSRAYLEITNCCNLSCSFCPGTRRKKAFLSPEQFRLLASRLRPHTNYLYLHVMGEPLLHPALEEILEIARELGFRVIVTTNGTLLPEKQQTLLRAQALHKISISLHSFEANSRQDLEAYLDGCLDFGKKAAQRGVIVDYRLWNLDGQTPGLNEKNGQIEARLHRQYPAQWVKNTWGWRLCDYTFLHYGERFEWPDLNANEYGTDGGCRGLRDQIAVLCDGTVTLCCLDHEGDAALGNLFEAELSQILALPRTQELLGGFQQHKRLHPLCRRCAYAQRFR